MSFENRWAAKAEGDDDDVTAIEPQMASVTGDARYGSVGTRKVKESASTRLRASDARIDVHWWAPFGPVLLWLGRWQLLALAHTRPSEALIHTEGSSRHGSPLVEQDTRLSTVKFR